MIERKVMVTNRLGLHLRAAAALVKTAAEFQSDIQIRKDDLVVNAKSIMALLGLEAARGVEIAIVAEGADEDTAIMAVAGLVEAKFNEEE
jgi:phosphocarrier protein HPr